MAKKPRIQVMPTEELKAWYQTKADEMGVSLSGLIVVAMQQYKQQTEAYSVMNDMSGMLEKLKQIQDKQEQLEKESKKNK